MTENNKLTPFVPFLDFNDPVLAELEKKIKPFLNNKPIDLGRELQIRTLLYVNFNKYLTLLIAKTSENTILETLKKMDESLTNNHLELVSAATKQTNEQIINNFIKLFDHTN